MKRRTFLTVVATAGVAGWALSRWRHLPQGTVMDPAVIDPLELGPKRTTPAPTRDVLEVLPELASQARDTIRLHPRRLLSGRHLPRDVSKMGGEFLWPADEAWPVCDVHDIPWVGILQLRAEDVPGFPFKPATDLFQLLWCPQDHGVDSIPAPVPYWRRRSDMTETLAEIPRPRFPTPAEVDQEMDEFLKRNQLTWLNLFAERPDYMRQQLVEGDTFLRSHLPLPDEILYAPIETDEQWQRVCALAKQLAKDVEASIVPPRYADRFYVPGECMLFPEVVREYPSYEDLTEEQRARLGAWDLAERGLRSNPEMVGVDLYGRELSVADGTKLGGHVDWIQSRESFLCEEGHPMEHLLTIASWECDSGNWSTWVPLEEQHFFARRTGVNQDPHTIFHGSAAHTIQGGAGLVIGDAGKTYVFVCRQCDDWPIRHTMQCS